MPKKRGAAPRRGAAERETARAAAATTATNSALPRTGTAVVAILAVVLVGTSLAVDTSAAAAFDAPKRAIALLGTALAAALALLASGEPGALRLWRDRPSLPKAAAILTGAALLGLLLSALLSPRRTASLDAMRSVALLAALLPLGASTAVARGKKALAAAFLGACAVNAAISILQGLGLYRPFALETAGGREDTGALAGNVGYLAIALAFASVLALALLLTARRRAVRILAGAALALLVADLLVDRNLTALTSAAGGVAAFLLVRFRRRAALPLLGAILVGGLLVAAYPPLRERARIGLSLYRQGDWNTLVSYRGGPWAAALEMIRERPLSGFGPGTFGAEYVPHRLAAEIRARRRFLSPLLTSSYGEAHSDYLQAASDGGVPVALLASAAAACLLAATAGAAWRRRSSEPALLFALLVAGAVAALTWFPLQRPITAVPLLLAAGRAWRVAADPDPGEAAP
jgi:O-antigen ligase